MVDLKDTLVDELREGRTALLDSLDGLSEHLVGIEHVYLGESFGRAPPDVPHWVADGSIGQGADMWATAVESGDHGLGLYDRACAHSDETDVSLDLDAPGSVPHWPEDRRVTTLGFPLVRMVEEPGHHAGHADICRELIDGRRGSDQDMLDEQGWRDHVAQVQPAADPFR